MQRRSCAPWVEFSSLFDYYYNLGLDSMGLELDAEHHVLLDSSPAFVADVILPLENFRTDISYEERFVRQ